MYYFDNNATTALDRDVLEYMLPYFKENYGNASSLYKLGMKSRNAIEESRDTISNCLNSKSSEIYFTSGGSEANNLAIKGICKANKGKHIITSKIEHPSIINSCESLKDDGYDITYINVDSNGFIDLDSLEKNIRDDTVLVSIMFANNEIGTIQPIKEISNICKKHNILFHTDAVQMIGNSKIDVEELGVDALSISAHKFYGPKGIGLLYVKSGVRFKSLIDGGKQEMGKRAGTENTGLIVGMSKALEKNCSEMESKNKYIKDLRDYLQKTLEKIPNIVINANVSSRLPGTLSVTVKGISNDSLLIKLDMMDICVSAGSACSALSIEPSHVLKAINLSDEDAKSTIRISIGKNNTKEEIDYLINSLKKIIEER